MIGLWGVGVGGVITAGSWCMFDILLNLQHCPLVSLVLIPACLASAEGLQYEQWVFSLSISVGSQHYSHQDETVCLPWKDRSGHMLSHSTASILGLLGSKVGTVFACLLPTGTVLACLLPVGTVLGLVSHQYSTLLSLVCMT
jgi:hypothetical protein